MRNYKTTIREAKPGGGGGTTTVQKADPWSGVQPFLTEAFQDASNLYNTNQLSALPYMGNTVAPFSRDTQSALDFTRQRALQGSPLIGAAQQQALQTSRGDYLSGGNPYLQNAISASFRPTIEAFRDSLLPSIEARAAQSGRFGSGAMADQVGKAQDTLARNLSEQSVRAFAQNYENERGRQQQSLLLAPQLAAEDYKDAERLAAVGDIQDQRQQALINEQIARFEATRDAPYNTLSRYLTLLGSGPGGLGTSTATQSGGSRSNPLLGGLGGAAAGYSLGGPIGAGIGGLIGLFG